MDLSTIIDIFLHLDQHLNQWAAEMGAWLYALLFAIVFAETGLVVTPFLPGDSLLFAVGALSATEGSPIDPWLPSSGTP
jgi:membrane-associated protein